MYSGLKVATFQERFASLFRESDKTIIELAKELHVSYQTISAWKIGTRSPKAPTVIAIASYFGVSVQWLLGFDVQKEPYDPYTDCLRYQRTPIVVPDSKRFIKLVHYMPQEDYVMVMEAFSRAEARLRQAEEQDDQVSP